MILLNFKTQIKGESQVEKHDDWILCDSMQMGVGRSISQPHGATTREVSNPSFSEITFSRTADKASPELWYQAVQGKSLGEAEIHLTQTGAEGTTQVYLIIKLTDPIISSFSASSGGDRPAESFSVNFAKCEFQYDTFTGEKKETGTPKKWDLAANKTF